MIGVQVVTNLGILIPQLGRIAEHYSDHGIG